MTFASTTRADVQPVLLSWKNREIVTLVPAAAADGPVTVEVEGRAVSSEFRVAPARVYFDPDVIGLFTFAPAGYDCFDCHPDQGGLDLSSVALILQGGDSGSAIVPRRSQESRLWIRLLPSTPVSSRMPQDGPYLTAEERLIVADWIDQGARSGPPAP